MKKHVANKFLTTNGLKTSVLVVGAGGTGSHFLHALARMHITMVALGHNGLHVDMIDDDIVEPHNVGRQLFGWGDVKANKAHAAIARVNRTYGTSWKAFSERMPLWKCKANIVVTAVDNNATRHEMQKVLRVPKGGLVPHMEVFEHASMLNNYYWLDMGNEDTYGQVVLGGGDLATSIEALGADAFPDVPAKDTCSMEQSITKQDLFINQQVATMGINILWNLFRRGKITYNASFINLAKGTMRSSLIPQQ